VSADVSPRLAQNDIVQIFQSEEIHSELLVPEAEPGAGCFPPPADMVAFSRLIYLQQTNLVSRTFKNK
jgi:hypothetical protein